MKITKILLFIITILFAILGLVKILPFDIANPIMLVKMKKGLLLENTMNIVTNEMNVSLKINKIVAGNQWVKENIKNLEELNYYER